MPTPDLESPPPLPPWARIVGSIAVVGHLGAILACVFARPSGPWQVGLPPSPPPMFAAQVNMLTLPYLSATRMTHTYKFQVDALRPSVYFEAELRDQQGQVFKTVKIPDPKANFWVRHRQQLLADGLYNDAMLPPLGSVRLGAPKRTYWDMVSESKSVLKTVPEHEVPRNPPAMVPSPWSLTLADSYSRYLRRTHRAASVELIRHSRNAVMPPNLLPPSFFGPEPRPPEAKMLFMEFVGNFGVFPRAN